MNGDALFVADGEIDADDGATGGYNVTDDEDVAGLHDKDDEVGDGETGDGVERAVTRCSKIAMLMTLQN